MTILSSFSFLFDGGGQVRSLHDKIVLDSNPVTLYILSHENLKFQGHQKVEQT